MGQLAGGPPNDINRHCQHGSNRSIRAQAAWNSGLNTRERERTKVPVRVELQRVLRTADERSVAFTVVMHETELRL